MKLKYIVVDIIRPLCYIYEALTLSRSKKIKKVRYLLTNSKKFVILSIPFK